MKGDAAVTLRRFMRISVLTVGKIKEKYFTSAIAEYSKRLGRYCRLEIVEVQDEKTPDKAPEAVNQQIKDKEGERLLSAVLAEDEALPVDPRVEEDAGRLPHHLHARFGVAAQVQFLVVDVL